ncbi:MAG: Gfo/Idh/MocA family oxidoreductase [Candidatus Omnitrophica bacterium]|nr:Gfo/Idh/MocA family oxidoreductase [Candidatus Omnitrophota bacterium]
MKKIKVAVIGIGRLGSIHAKLYKEIPSSRLCAVCDIDTNRLNQISRELKIPGYKDYRELFDKVDAVSIAAPTYLHYRIARDFLNRRIHVLVEKPFVTKLKEAEDLIEIAQKNKLILQVGHVERFNSAFTATQKLIKNPRFIECHRLSPFPYRSLDIGVVLDLMIHDIDIVLGLINSPLKKIEAIGVKVLTDLEDIANARLTFKNGCVCNLTASRVSDEHMRKIRIFLENAYISLDYRNEEAFIYRKTPSGITKETLPIEKEQPLKRELVSFVDCVAYNKLPLVTGKVAKEALAVALEIRRKIWRRLKIS